ncbi:RtcB family protein [Alistipes sp. OttesenSCG-928-B03]|nr:RtcB family protein [Alistipes sp. OttesenSCG-928-B03]
MNIRLKDLSKLGYTDNVARSLAVMIVGKNCKHKAKQEIETILSDVLADPKKYKGDEVWGKLAEHFAPTLTEQQFKVYGLNEKPLPYKKYGSVFIEPLAKQQMDMAMRLPVTVAGALMPDGHAGYGLPIGGVLATDNVVIPYAVGMDIGCRMSLTVFDANPEYMTRYSHQIKEALKQFTHFGINGGLGIKQEHKILDDPAFRQTDLLKVLQGKAVRQLGTSGGGNHFVEFGQIELYEGNAMNLPAGGYTALLSHSGSRGVGAAIAKHYSNIAREVCKLPREAQNFAWLDLNSEAGQEYWLSMNLAGDFAVACHEQIHTHLSKALGLDALSNVSNHHNFAWREEIAPGQTAIIHRKGATPAGECIAGIIPGSMTTPGYLVCGKGVPESLNSASHGVGRAMSRQKAKQQFTQSSLKKLLSQSHVTLLGGSVEECPLAYKDIDKVMKAQRELVEVQGRFMPRIVRMHKE